MNNKFFSKIWIVVVILIIGGLFVCLYWWVSKEKITSGKIAKEKTMVEEELTTRGKVETGEKLTQKTTPESEETHLLENKIENWDLYREIEGEKDKWVGAGFCGNKEFEDVLIKAKSGSMKILKLNNELELVVTPNYKGWTTSKFVAFNDDPTAICSAGGRYPLYAYPDKLLWMGVCSTGLAPERNSPEYKELEECEKDRNIVKSFFEKK